MRFDLIARRIKIIRFLFKRNEDGVESIEFLDDLKSTHIEMWSDNNINQRKKWIQRTWPVVNSTNWWFETQLQFDSNVQLIS